MGRFFCTHDQLRNDGCNVGGMLQQDEPVRLPAGLAPRCLGPSLTLHMVVHMDNHPQRATQPPGVCAADARSLCCLRLGAVCCTIADDRQQRRPDQPAAGQR